MIRAVFFDFGGVLTETCWDLNTMTELIQKACIEHGIHLPDSFADLFNSTMYEKWLKVLRTQIEERLEDILWEIFEKIGINDRTVLDKAIDYILDAPFCIIRKETPDVLRELKSMGLKIGIISNSPIAFHRRVLSRNGLLHFFDDIVISCEVNYRKPNPKIFKIALKRLDVKPSEAVFIGDSLSVDIVGAKKAGLVAVLMKYGDPAFTEEDAAAIINDPAEPDYVIESLEEVIEIVKTESKRRINM